MERIQKHMKQVFQSYIEILNSKNEKQFWDLVVLTTYDEAQRQFFEKQVEDLFGAGHLLKGKLHIIGDPPDRKLGCGGSTLHVLKTLVASYGPNLYEKRILIIHSGGTSQRLPSYSIQGKIFSPVPLQDFLAMGTGLNLMLNLKLAMYLPFCRYLQPGIFVTCSDDIETYVLESDSLSKEVLKTADVVALAHPCDLETATKHGVYVLPDISSKTGSVVVSECLEVLQKPSLPLMRTKKAVVHNENTKEDMVYSDSVFWMSERAYRPLLSWYLASSLHSDLDAYAHFLPCLGVNMKNCAPEQFTDYRRDLLPLLRNSEFKVIVLKESKFYHLGTMDEYLNNFTRCKSFQGELSIALNTSNVSRPFLRSEGNRGKTESQPLMVYSYISENCRIELENDTGSMVEWCVVELPIHLPCRVIMSNCVLRKSVGVEYLHNPVSIFRGFLYHTAPILPAEGGTPSYVTVAYEVEADMKRSSNDALAISIASVPLDRVMREGRLRKAEVLADGKPYSLWNLKLFREAGTAEESFWKTHHFVNLILHWRDGVAMETNLDKLLTEGKSRLFSLKEIVKLKDLEAFLKDRKKLLELVHS